MIFHRHTDQPSIRPATPSAALWRLEQLQGALEREGDWEAMPILHQSLARAQAGLLEAARRTANPQQELAQAQDALYAVYGAATQGEDARERVLRLGFPDIEQKAPDFVAPIDTSTIVVTHFKPQKQVFSTLAFDEAHGATAYWLYEVRSMPDGSDVTEAIVQNFAPCFQRVRLPIGPHRFFIESRNPSRNATSEEFFVEVPNL